MGVDRLRDITALEILVLGALEVVEQSLAPGVELRRWHEIGGGFYQDALQFTCRLRMVVGHLLSKILNVHRFGAHGRELTGLYFVHVGECGFIDETFGGRGELGADRADRSGHRIFDRADRFILGSRRGLVLRGLSRWCV